MREPEKQLTIAIDFDGTFAEDPDVFREIVAVFKARGHQCILVTNRPKEWGDDVHELVGDLMPIVFAGHRAKSRAVHRLGYDVDIWVDDMPQIIEIEGVAFHGGVA